MNISKNKKGILFIIGSAFCFSLMSLFIRLSGELPVMQKCFFRNFVAMLIAVGALIKEKQPIRFGKGNLKYLLLRAIGGTFGMIFNFYAIDHLPISDAAILNKLSPFFAIVFSVIFIGEVATKMEWLAVATAFAGALFVVKPTFNVEVIPAVAGALGGCFAGLAYTFLRKLGMRGENSMIIVFFFSAFSCLVTIPFTIINFVPMTGKQWLYLWMTGIAAAGGQLCITKAYTYAPAKEISVYDFTNVLFAALWGFFILDQVPDVFSIVGYVIIIGTAIVKWKLTLDKEKRNIEQKQEEQIK